MRLLAALALIGLLAGPARAALTAADTAKVGVFPPPDATAPLSLAFTDDAGRPTSLGAAMGGRPTLLVFSDYRCTSLCGPALVLAKAALQQTHLRPGRDYRLVVIGIDPRDGPAAAAAMRAERIGDDPALSRAASFLSGSPAAIAAATRALGFSYRYDADHDVYAHPVAAYALARDGRAARVISEIGFRPAELQSALLQAGQGRIAPLAYPLHILCYCFDTAAGLYNGDVLAALRIGGAAIVLALALGLVAVARRGARP
ncbi:MAG TPA: SCO family protein [Caulobacteraceae bacterium]